MLTYGLWRAIRRPPTRNPLFRRAYLYAEQPAAWYAGCVRWAGILIFLPILAFAGLIYGFGWSAGVATQLGRERESRTFDLLSLTPPGPLGMSWAAAFGHLHQQRTFRNVNNPANIVVRAGLAALSLVTVGVALDVIAYPVVPPLWQMGLFGVTLLLALVADHAQSVVAAVLCGIVGAHSAGQRLSAQLYGFTLYSAVQIATYLVTLTLGFALIPTAASPQPVLTLAVVIFRLFVFCGSRELLIWLVWRWIDRMIAPDPYEQRILLGRPTRKVTSVMDNP